MSCFLSVDYLTVVYCLVSALTVLVKVHFNVNVATNLQAWAYCMLQMSVPWTKHCLWFIFGGLVMTVIFHLPAPIHQSWSSQIRASCRAVFLTVLHILMKCPFCDKCHTIWLCGILYRILGDDQSNMASVCTLMNNSGSFMLSKSVLWLRWLLTGLSQHRGRVGSRPVLVVFLVDQVALGQVFLRVFWYLLLVLFH
jgi:hypothetical protein